MIDFRRSGLDDRVKQQGEQFGICAFERLAMGIVEKCCKLGDELGGHFQLVFRVYSQFEVPHAFQEVLYP